MAVSELGNVIEVFPAGQMIMVDKFLSYSAPSIDENIVLSASTFILTIAVQLLNARFPMVVSEFGSVIDVSASQPENASSPMAVSELGSVIDVSPMHLANAKSPMVVSELDSVIDVSLMQP